MLAILLTSFGVSNGVSSQQQQLSTEAFIVKSREELEDIRQKGEKIFKKLTGKKIDIFFIEIHENPRVCKNITLTNPSWLISPEQFLPPSLFENNSI